MKNTILLATTLSLAPVMSGTIFAEEIVPEGLSRSDWSSISETYKAGRHAVHGQDDGGHTAHNPGQQWHTEFDGRGFLVRPEHGEWTWGMDLQSVDGHSVSGSPEVSAKDNTLRYQWSDQVEEWFINDQRGLEQGWTIQSGSGDEQDFLTLDFKLRGVLQPVISLDGTSVAFQNNDATVMTYAGLKAWDANHKPLDVRFVAGTGDSSLGIVVDDREASYPITIDPVAQQAYLKASNAGSDDNFGYSVAISNDTVVVGAIGEDGDAASTAGAPNDNASSAGAAYVFVRSGTSWAQEEYLKSANAGAGDYVGYSVAISGDTVVVGADRERGDSSSTAASPNDNALWAGAAYVFVRSGTNWSQEAYLKASNAGNFDQFGRSVAISGDTVVVGAIDEDGDASSTAASPNDNTSGAGAAYVFVRSGTNWSQQGYLKASNVSGDLGSSVAISGDTVVVGATGDDGDATSTAAAPNINAADAGAAYVFVRSGTNWSQQDYLKASNAGAGDEFGTSVAISGDTVVVGALYEDGDASSTAAAPNDNASDAGAAYVFVRSGTSWNQQAYLKASNVGASDEFGSSVSISGETAVVGAPEEEGDASSTAAAPNDNASDAGAAYVYKVEFAGVPEIVVEEPVGNDLIDGGAPVDFGIGMIGSTSDVRVFTVRNLGSAELTGLSVVATGDYSVDDSLLGSSIAPGGFGTFSVTFSPNSEGTRSGTLQIFSNDADENPFDIDLTGEGLTPAAIAQKAYLKGSNAGGGDNFGYSVAISGDTMVVGAYQENGDASSTAAAPNDNAGDAGAAYVFVRSGTNWIQQAYLKASNAETGDSFGYSVAISGDTVVVGALYEDGDAASTAASPNDNADDAGAAYVFVRSGTSWSQQAYLKASNAGAFDELGWSVSISGDTVVVGAWNEDGDATSTAAAPNDFADDAGAAYVFVRSGTSWSQQGYLKASSAGGEDFFGWSVAISGESVVVGASGEDGDATSTAAAPNDNAIEAGAAYVFVRSGANWSEQAYLKASNAGFIDLFGDAVAISGDTLVVGARLEGGDATSTAATPNDNASNAGAAYVFVRSGSSWGQEAYLKASNAGAEDYFGDSVAISGGIVVVGARDGFFDHGAAYVFERSGTDWGEQAFLTASNLGLNDRFGESVAFSGGTVLVGAPQEDGDATSTAAAPNDIGSNYNAGAAYVFEATSAAEAAFASATSTAGLSGADALPDATPFNDDVPNLLKYAFNMNLSGPDVHGMATGGSSGLPGGGLVEVEGETYWRVQYVRRVGSGLIYTPKKSTTLEPGSFESMTGAVSEEEIDDDWVRVTVDEPCDPATTPKCFSHVEVTLP